MRTNKRVGAVIIKDDKVLLIHRLKNGSEYWVLPGGGIEDGENVDEALRREVKEETSLDLVNYDFLGFHEHEGHEHYFYGCELSEGTPKIGGPEKEESGNNNVYILEWVLKKKTQKMELYPVFSKIYLK
jgi:8-oxo-dGTP pyrophosphatase MutT (NUDIX family)